MDRSSAYQRRISERVKHRFNRVELETLPLNYVQAIYYYNTFAKMDYSPDKCWALTVCKLLGMTVENIVPLERKAG